MQFSEEKVVYHSSMQSAIVLVLRMKNAVEIAADKPWSSRPGEIEWMSRSSYRNAGFSAVAGGKPTSR
jgi:hypothetical protein